MRWEYAASSAPLTADPPSHRFKALDGWRGICALMVVLFHLNAATHVYALTRNAWVAVDFFFVLSGFVLTSGFESRVDSPAALGVFSARRLARLYPLHLATLVVLLALLAAEAWRNGTPLFAAAHGLDALLQCLMLVQGFTTEALSWNFPSWSISIELWASLLLGLALWLARSNAWMVFGLSACLLATLILVYGEPAGPAATEQGALLKAAHYLMAFAVGVVLFKLFARLSRRAWRPPAWVEWPAALLVLATFLLADRMNSPGTVGIFAAVILVFAFEDGRVSLWLRKPAFQSIGRWSYSIYLVHPLWTILTFKVVLAAGGWSGLQATDVASGARLTLGGPFAMDLAAGVCLAMVVGTAALTYRIIEKPGTRLANLVA